MTINDTSRQTLADEDAEREARRGPRPTEEQVQP